MLFRTVLLTVILASSSALADIPLPPPAAEIAHITSAKMHPDVMNGYTAGAGSVSVNVVEGTVDLFLLRIKVCPADRACTRELPTPLMVKLPIVSIETDACGVREIRAFEDERRVDGMMQELVVRDARKMICDVHVPPTAVTYRTGVYSRMSGKEVKTKSFMMATPMRPDRR